MAIEYEHPDVLQNIEFAVTMLFRKNPDMSDYDVLRVYEDLLDDYKNELTGNPLKKHKQSALEAQLFEDVRTMCEWRLGRQRLPIKNDDNDDIVTENDPIDIPTLVRCFKRLIKSVKIWNKYTGRQGYLNYMSEFIT